jgi:hypothetical protein
MDPKFDIPLPETVFDDLVDRKYTNTTADHHWLDPDGEQVSEFTFIETYPGYWNYIPTPEAQAVSNYDYELEENDKKRWIKIIKKDMLPDLLNEVEALLGSYIKK